MSAGTRRHSVLAMSADLSHPSGEHSGEHGGEHSVCLVASHGVHCGPDRGGLLLAVMVATHTAVTAEFAAQTDEADFRAIARLSTHLAAMRRAVRTPVGRLPGQPARLAATWCAEARGAERALRLLQRRLSGELAAMRQPLESVHALLRECLDGCLRAERALAAWIDKHLPEPHRERLIAGYLACLHRAPSRPHPRAPRSGPAYRLVFGCHAFWDRVLDTTDCRPGVGHGFLRIKPGENMMSL